MAKGGKRHHRFFTGADRRAGRSGAATSGRQRVVRRIAGHLAGGLLGARGRGAPLGGERLARHDAGQRLRFLRTADGTTAGADMDLVQDLRGLPELGGHLHDDVVLVLGFVDYRYLTLPKGVVEGVVDLADGEAE